MKRLRCRKKRLACYVGLLQLAENRAGWLVDTSGEHSGVNDTIFVGSNQLRCKLRAYLSRAFMRRATTSDGTIARA